MVDDVKGLSKIEIYDVNKIIRIKSYTDGHLRLNKKYTPQS